MSSKFAKADVMPIRQRTQYTCMATSMTMALQACGHSCTEDEVNRIMGCRPGHGARWEDALACAQHYGCRAHLTVPATLTQVKEWTDAGKPVLIAWNPEGRDWSHASLVFDVTDGPEGRMVHVADPNIPNPEKTVRVVSEDEFYGKWYEKWPNYLVRRPACVIEREIDEQGRQVRASKKAGMTPVEMDAFLAQARTAEMVARVAERFANQPEIEKSGYNRWVANQAFVDAVRRAFSDVIIEGSPRGGYAVFSDDGDDDVYVSPSRDRQGWYEINLAGSSRGAFLKDIGRAVGVRIACEDNMKDDDPKTADKDKDKVKGPAPARRNEVVREMIERSWGSGTHKNKGQRGTGEKGKGKGQRHPKHKKDLSRMATRVAIQHLVAADYRTLDAGLRRKINTDLIRHGLDGNTYFRKPEDGYSRAVDVLIEHGLELDGIVSSHLFRARPSGTISADVAFTNFADRFSPIPITNSNLYLQFTELREGSFEVVAYMS